MPGQRVEGLAGARRSRRSRRSFRRFGSSSSSACNIATRPKEILEEHLQSVLLRQSLHFERRLPLLAVIATAAPLMGLLGTVVGMVKTFALITVFGTGNAGKLASGISEVLVATELGLIVAIPTLIAHGFLAHRIQRNLSIARAVRP
jgi:biopolymer transport protein ExbB